MSLNDLWIEFLQNQGAAELNSQYETPPVATHTADNTVTNASETLLAENLDRRAVIIQNTDADDSVRVNLAGATATTTNGLQLKPGISLILSSPNCPTSAITAIREGSADVTVHVVEFE